ncbi:hypothetical protein V502_11421 [Pseudogymnoascus sp. VKM F-4520 (FW-2644)]|nr:hypothetical protein V502_11421 [Pseudogymnoascus sp. VKM F-4520 (FW-2644)]
MKVTIISTLALSTAVAGLTCPTNSGGGCGQYTVSGDSERRRHDQGSRHRYDGDREHGNRLRNWGMLRASCSQFTGQSTADYNNGAVLNSNLKQDIQCRHESESFYGFQTWVAGHRNGKSGLANPGTSDIELYMSAIEWTQQQLESGSYLTDDTRFWVDVQEERAPEARRLSAASFVCRGTVDMRRHRMIEVQSVKG